VVWEEADGVVGSGKNADAVGLAGVAVVFGSAVVVGTVDAISVVVAVDVCRSCCQRCFGGGCPRWCC